MIYSKFYQSILSDLGNLENGLNIAVAVSGGSDSMALSILFNRLIKEYNGKLHCVTINHQLREESDIEAIKVREILRSYDINHHIIPWIGPKPKSNIQENARLARYKLLTEYCHQHGIKYLATGHQKNDQAENFIIRADHGSGINGLSGIPKVTIMNDITIIRPLLEFNKKELQEFLESQNIEWIEDPSNQNEQFTRVKVRNLLKQYPEWIDKLNVVSKNLPRAKECVDHMLNNSIKELVTYPIQDSAVFEFTKFNELPQEIRFRMLAKLLQDIGGNLKPARAERIEGLMAKIELGMKFKASTLAGCLIRRKKEQIIIKLEENPQYN